MPEAEKTATDRKFVPARYRSPVCNVPATLCANTRAIAFLQENTLAQGSSISTKWPFVGLQLSNITFNAVHAFTAILYPWVMFDLTRDVGWTAAMAGATAVMLVVGMYFGGYVCGRLGSRFTLLACAKANVVTGLLVAALYSAGLLSPGMLIALGLISTTLDGPGIVAMESRAPEIARLSRISGARARMLDSSILLGLPVLAAVLLGALTPQDALWVSAATSFVSMALVSLSMPRFRPAGRPGAGHHARARRWLSRTLGSPAQLLAASATLGFFMTLQVLVVPLALRLGGHPLSWLGLFVATSVIGTLGMNLYIAMAEVRAAPAPVISGSLIGLALATAILAGNLSPLAIMVSGLAAGCANGWLSPAFSGLFQVTSARQMRASVLGMSYAVIILFIPLGHLVAGAVLSALPLATAAPLIAVLLLMASVIGALKL